MDLASIMRRGSALNTIYGIGDTIYKQFYKNEKEANKQYRAMYPSLRLVHVKYGRDSKEFVELLSIFSSLTPIGVKRKNFIRKFVTNKEGWMFLPKDPDDIMFGHWW